MSCESGVSAYRGMRVAASATGAVMVPMKRRLLCMVPSDCLPDASIAIEVFTELLFEDPHQIHECAVGLLDFHLERTDSLFEAARAALVVAQLPLLNEIPDQRHAIRPFSD